jgi:hypothetical protein
MSRDVNRGVVRVLILISDSGVTRNNAKRETAVDRVAFGLRRNIGAGMSGRESL